MTPRFRATLLGDEYTPARLEELVTAGTRTKYGLPIANPNPNPNPNPKPKPNPNPNPYPNPNPNPKRYPNPNP